VAQRPVLDQWLAGAAPSHPLNQPNKPGFFLDAFEAVVAPIDAVKPNRLPTKIKALRTLKTDGELLEQRAELLIGSMLARGQVAFEFAKDHPDYVLSDGIMGIEVGSRAIDGPWALTDRLEQLLAASGSDIYVALSFDDRPLKLGAARVAEIAEQIAHSEFDSPVLARRFDDVGLSATLHRGPVGLISQVTVTFAGGLGLPLASHMDDVEREVANKVAEKTHQAEKMPTILLVDIALTGPALVGDRRDQLASLDGVDDDTAVDGPGLPRWRGADPLQRVPVEKFEFDRVLDRSSQPLHLVLIGVGGVRLTGCAGSCGVVGQPCGAGVAQRGDGQRVFTDPRDGPGEVIRRIASLAGVQIEGPVHQGGKGFVVVGHAALVGDQG
jgi:hypothetical protein